MKAIHNRELLLSKILIVVLYPKDTEKWKQFTTKKGNVRPLFWLFCIPKILKNESNSQQQIVILEVNFCCFVSQRYWKMKAIHNLTGKHFSIINVVLYPKDTEKWKQFTTCHCYRRNKYLLFCIPKILKNESNSQRVITTAKAFQGCFVSQRYWKMKAIHNKYLKMLLILTVVLYPKDTEKWKQFTTFGNYYQGQYWLFCIPKILKNEI